jgi:hypothetical protein
LVLAGLQLDDDAWRFVCDELCGCDRCWEYVTRQLVSLFAGQFALRAGSLDSAADVAAQSILENLGG